MRMQCRTDYVIISYYSTEMIPFDRSLFTQLFFNGIFSKPILFIYVRAQLVEYLHYARVTSVFGFSLKQTVIVHAIVKKLFRQLNFRAVVNYAPASFRFSTFHSSVRLVEQLTFRISLLHFIYSIVSLITYKNTKLIE